MGFDGGGGRLLKPMGMGTEAQESLARPPARPAAILTPRPPRTVCT